VRESLVLLKNRNGILPLSRKLNVLVAGDGADNIGKQSGGWTLTWQGTDNTNADFPGATSIFAGIKAAVTAGGGTATLSVDGSFKQKPDVAIVVFGEQPYAEYFGNVKSLDYQGGKGADAALLARLKQAGIAVISIFLSGRPLWVNAELNASDAFVAAWLPGSEGAGIADVIFRNSEGAVNHDFTGKLSFSWPRWANDAALNRNDTNYDPLFAYGFGLTLRDKDTLADDLPVQ
jgi:beta-glucosidase